ncbi:hypothetical protein PPERSA_07287 [Pseudocohnilembus persalinus]|uniref:Uncharacterized protein n=1 Tax=Pseudocohnilembus persalinus TaxID=266149 RepID=A0A0V0QGK5_PSEPJ|nr:hypothetical protein PPERSA_07287 [Pseudocohnilembus persalinus]|eukprot:KRX01248.1 hypothetical protein PPERSA_07287 [Pseudocohnilembus persalinus]
MNGNSILSQNNVYEKNQEYNNQSQQQRLNNNANFSFFSQNQYLKDDPIQNIDIVLHDKDYQNNFILLHENINNQFSFNNTSQITNSYPYNSNIPSQLSKFLNIEEQDYIETKRKRQIINDAQQDIKVVQNINDSLNSQKFDSFQLPDTENEFLSSQIHDKNRNFLNNDFDQYFDLNNQKQDFNNDYQSYRDLLSQVSDQDFHQEFDFEQNKKGQETWTQKKYQYFKEKFENLDVNMYDTLFQQENHRNMSDNSQLIKNNEYRNIKKINKPFNKKNNFTFLGNNYKNKKFIDHPTFYNLSELQRTGDLELISFVDNIYSPNRSQTKQRDTNNSPYNKKYKLNKQYSCQQLDELDEKDLNFLMGKQNMIKKGDLQDLQLINLKELKNDQLYYQFNQEIQNLLLNFDIKQFEDQQIDFKQIDQLRANFQDDTYNQDQNFQDIQIKEDLRDNNSYFQTSQNSMMDKSNNELSFLKSNEKANNLNDTSNFLNQQNISENEQIQNPITSEIKGSVFNYEKQNITITEHPETENYTSIINNQQRKFQLTPDAQSLLGWQNSYKGCVNKLLQLQ